MAKVETDVSTPSLLSFEDLASGQINTAVTPGNIGVINGHRLKFEPAQADEGVYFINTADGTEVKVAAIQKNKPGQQVFLIPAIPAATNLYLEVRAHFGTDLRSGRLETTLDT